MSAIDTQNTDTDVSTSQYNTIQYSFITVADRPLRRWHIKVQQYNKQTTATQDSTVGQYCD